MRTQHSVTIVVPVFNEAENFPLFYQSICRHVRERFRIVVVYDSPDDTTLPVARQISRRDERVELVRNFRPGVAGALRTGLAHVVEGPVIVSMADLSDDHAKIEQMLRLHDEGADLVVASRYCPGGRQLGGPLLKRALSQGAGWSLRMLGALPTSDPTNSFKLYSQRLLESVNIESAQGFALALELTVKAHALGLRIAEVPATWHDRTAGKSNFRIFRWLPTYLRWYVQALAARRKTPTPTATNATAS